MLVSDLKKSVTWSKLPKFIRNAGVFEHIKRIEKPFPEIGLKNIVEPIEDSFPEKPAKAFVGFSSQGMQGVWDIATMSMRGICSCMHWENEHSIHLVGSVADPFLGIVYITDNDKTPYGTRFKWRSLVRFVYSISDKKYQLLLERVYKDTGNTIPTVYNNKDPDGHYKTAIFKKFLKKHLNTPIDVVDPTERTNDYRGYTTVIPMSDGLRFLKNAEVSMSDCRQVYGHVDDKFVQKFAAQI